MRNGTPKGLSAIDRYAVAVDIVLFTIQDGSLKVLLVRRDRLPFRGRWSLPGGFVRTDESVDEAALRELQEETNIGNVYLEQLYTFGEQERDPRGRVLTVAYYALVNPSAWALVSDAPFAQGVAQRTGRQERLHWQRVRGRLDVSAAWFAVKRLPELAFDHRRIIEYALERLRNKINYTTVGFQLLSRQFTLTELQTSYEIILAQRLDKRNFRKKMLQLGILKDTGDLKANGRQRPARLYTFTEPKVIKLQEKGIIVPF